MKHNVGTTDRIIRVVIGMALMAAAGVGYIGWWGWLGVVPVATGLMSHCLLYRLLGINTGAKEKP